jgi:protein AroM
MTLGVLTIGQAPRADRLGPEVSLVLGDTARIVERGALDDLSAAAIRALVPAPDREPLVSLLRNGTSVRLDMDAIVPLLQQRIDQLESEDGVVATLLVCGGDFPTLRHQRPLIQPHNALHGVVTGIAGAQKLASMVPIPDQVEPIERGWRRFREGELCMVIADPYTADSVEQVRGAAEAARNRRADFLYMECFGYTLAMREVARAAFGGPVLLARSLAGRMLGEFC